MDAELMFAAVIPGSDADTGDAALQPIAVRVTMRGDVLSPAELNAEFSAEFRWDENHSAYYPQSGEETYRLYRDMKSAQAYAERNLLVDDIMGRSVSRKIRHMSLSQLKAVSEILNECQ